MHSGLLLKPLGFTVDASITGSGETIFIKCKPNMNLMNPETVMKAVKYQLSKGVNHLETVVTYPID